jgi:hypothetical protein
MRDALRRTRAVSLAGFAVAALGVVVVGACAEYKRELGSECLKDEDCLTGICTSSRCASAPPYLPPGATYPVPEAGPAAADAAGDAPSEGAVDAGGG